MASLPGVKPLSCPMRIFSYCLFFFFGLQGSLWAAEPLRLDFPRKMPIQKHLEYFVDAGNSIDIDRVASSEGDALFSSIGKKKGFGYSRSTFWFRFSAVNPTMKSITWYLEHVYPVIDEIDFYIPGPEGWKMFQSGDFRPFSTRPVNFRTSVFPVEQPPGTQTFYIRIKSNGSIAIPFVAWTASAFESHIHSDNAFHWIYYGIMLSTILYNLFIFLSVREISYLYLIAFIMGSSVFTMAHSGMAFQYLWPDFCRWANACHPFFGFIGLTASVQFTRSFLATRETYPGFDRVLSVFFIFGLFLIFAPFWLEYHYTTQSMAIYGTLGALTMIYGGVVLFFRGVRQSRFFLLAWTSWVLSVFLMFMKSFGFLPSNLITDSGVQVGTGLLVIFFSFGLADKINTMQRERKKALEEVQQSEKRYRLLAENVKDVIWTIDLETMKYTYLTPSVASFRGFTCEEAMNLSMAETLTPDSQKRVKETVRKELETDRLETSDPNRSRTIELEYYHKNGSTVWAEVTTTFFRDENGKPIGITGVTRDITERRRAEAERKRLEIQLQQSQKMEAIGTLAGGIAHDFNNILSAIMGNIEISLAGLAKDGKLAVRLRRVLDACERAKDLVLQILMFSRRSEQARKPVYMNYIIKEVLKLIRASLPSTINIKQDITLDKKIVLSDPIHIHQVVMNLCSNAADAMRESGGVLGIRLDSIVLNREAAEKYHRLSPGDYIRLTVTDTGYGMDPAVMERIFDPFYTTKEQGKGTGMGLSLVHGIVTKMGGAVHVTSRPEKGSVFQVFFPKAGEDLIADEEETDDIPTGNERILFVDDEINIVDMAREMLSGMGYLVTSTASSREAQSIFEKQPEAFDLVITDQTMPDLTGMNLAKAMLRTRSDIPIILCTGFADLIEPEMLQSIGIRELVLKPYSKISMARLIRKLLEPAGK
ncbi:MAG: 7TM diverse intracellular signaling domain-containing protein [Pseudomonadota bacterium]